MANEDEILKTEASYFVRSSIKVATSVRKKKFSYSQLSLRPIKSMFKIKSVKRPASLTALEHQPIVKK
ncbi:MAG: hypothetical protein A2504_03560 [Bdellovibrionales bacterium RIFOXYD12_FULL_39_22]|nr:MAG: hypothetical protein A2385_11310 [Bdellovibrionales bacterium RIFOXYB1_FULL_39_21]OFZ41657.1 MAG: hypothetical protein A2485_01620 [Bdellovibrionales bacterium RIFOXYC12_FULL_39_17]OFZ46057.1 MAG: hypothetical protein A2404_11985 [Bdellovibrionales bacterium RIFOXYC1_FULL_39_130]OFZ74884.1 MAG: hypothetical protein A2560_15025 [Bdellovibrionales bacterium RIFOXYD1_FULL_39_84]OFZ92737.1 MAG: hypothetical protein A2504_03560 [Bdellovibrionales bacterium RIFOXYD12_FULL_39_22]HLE12518.1 hy